MFLVKRVVLIASLSLVWLQAKYQTIDYRVKRGDSLSVIAKRYDTTVEKIKKINRLKNNYIIKRGQILKIISHISKKKSKKYASHKVKSRKIDLNKNTLYGIGYFYGNRLNTPIESSNANSKVALKVANELPSFGNNNNDFEKYIHKSHKIDYTVKMGDTLYAIAHNNHTTIKDILDLNNMKAGDMIRVGQNLKVMTNTYFPDKSTDSKKNSEISSSDDNKEEDKNGTYKVQSGDTLFSIAKNNHITLKELMTLNNLKLNDIIKAGQELTIINKKSFIDSKSLEKVSKVDNKVKLALETKKYKVRRKDTIKKIAKRFDMSVGKLRKLNHLSRKSKLKKGMILAVIEKTKTKKYRVKRGDTLWLIAKKNNISLKKLRALNHFSKKDIIHTGMLLSVGDVAQKVQNKSTNIYKVKKGDTWTKIARLHKISIKKLKKLNHIGKRAKLKRGMILALSSDLSKRAKRAQFALKSKSKWGRGGYNIIRTAKRYLGRRYVWGAEGPRTFDCSGFTQYVLRKSKGVRLPRVSRRQAYYGKYVSRRNLRAGDLIFFDTSHRRRGYVNHVGIYIGNNKFIHASSARHRVVITSLNRPFYSARFKWGRRVY